MEPLEALVLLSMLPAPIPVSASKLLVEPVRLLRIEPRALLRLLDRILDVDLRRRLHRQLLFPVPPRVLRVDPDHRPALDDHLASLGLYVHIRPCLDADVGAPGDRDVL